MARIVDVALRLRALWIALDRGVGGRAILADVDRRDALIFRELERDALVRGIARFVLEYSPARYSGRPASIAAKTL